MPEAERSLMVESKGRERSELWHSGQTGSKSASHKKQFLSGKLETAAASVSSAKKINLDNKKQTAITFSCDIPLTLLGFVFFSTGHFVMGIVLYKVYKHRFPALSWATTSE